MDISKLTKNGLRILSENSPAILTGMAVAGTITTAVFAGRGSIQADRHMTKVYDEMEKAEDHSPVTKKDVLKETWKFYIPAAIMGASTIACIIAAHSVHTRRNAAVMAAYSLTETAFSEYKDKILEEIGEEKEQKIREAVGVDHIKKNQPPANDSSLMIVDGEAKTLFRDAMSGRYFKSDMETVRRAVNDINERCIGHNYASLNEFYSLLDLEHTILGDELGWMADKLMDVTYSAHLSDDGRPCVDINYVVGPYQGYYRGF